MQTTHATIEVKKEEVQNAHPIVVTGERVYNFSPYHWRQAIRQYLACIWTNHFSGQEVIDLTIPTYAPECGNDCYLLLRCHAVGTRYEAFGAYDETFPPILWDVRRGSVLEVAVNQPEQMEASLARFAWNRQMRALCISLPGCRHMKGLWLWSHPGGLRVFKELRNN
jgi:hypothetical protein